MGHVRLNVTFQNYNCCRSSSANLIIYLAQNSWLHFLYRMISFKNSESAGKISVPESETTVFFSCFGDFWRSDAPHKRDIWRQKLNSCLGFETRFAINSGVWLTSLKASQTMYQKTTNQMRLWIIRFTFTLSLKRRLCDPHRKLK
jgi:hypothetical protein